MRKINRLLENSDFTRVLNKGKKMKSDVYLVGFMPNKENHIRVGISVSKKIGDAVVRVRVRRQVRAMITIMKIISKPYDVVIIPKNNFLKNDFEHNLNVLEGALKILLDGRDK